MGPENFGREDAGKGPAGKGVGCGGGRYGADARLRRRITRRAHTGAWTVRCRARQARPAHRDGRRSVFRLRAPGPGPLRGGGRRAAWWCGAAAGGPPDRAAGAGGGARRVRSLVDCHHSRPRRPTILTTCCGPVEHGDASTHLCAHSMAKCHPMTSRRLMNVQLRRGGWTKQPKAGGGGPNATGGVGRRRGHRPGRTPVAGARGHARPVRRAVDGRSRYVSRPNAASCYCASRSGRTGDSKKPEEQENPCPAASC